MEIHCLTNMSRGGFCLGPSYIAVLSLESRALFSPPFDLFDLILRGSAAV